MPSRLARLLICNVIVLSLPSFAAQRITFKTKPLIALPPTMLWAVPGYASSGHPPTTDGLMYIRQRQDEQGIVHTRLQQTYAGFPVHGGYIIVHNRKAKVLAQDSNARLTGAIYQDLATDLGVPPQDLTARAQQALQQFSAQYVSAFISEQTATPMIYIDSQHRATWAFKVSLSYSPTDSMPQKPHAIVDATTFKPLIQWDEIKTQRAFVKGIGFGGNARVGKYQFGKNNWPYLTVTRNDFYQRCFMENTQVKVVDMGGHYVAANLPIEFDCLEENSPNKGVYWTGYNGDGYDRIHQAYSPANDALHAGNTIQSLYKQWYNVDVLAMNDKPLRLIMRIHFAKNYENAFWDGKQMTFGDGGYSMYPLVSVDVTAHEVSHGFTEQYSNLNYHGESGGINESFSDMASQVAEYFVKGKNSWLIGADIMRETSGDALRYMAQPSLDGHSIEHADQFQENMNVHYSSGILNRFFYLLATSPGWTPREAFHVALKANMDYWVPTTNFIEAGCGLRSAAKDLQLSVVDVEKALLNVGIDFSEC